MFSDSKQPPIQSDAELARAAQRGDKRAFVEIVMRHQAMVCSITLGVSGDFATSEDAAQDAFLRAWRSIKDLREPEKLRAWLAHIARNAALRQLERARGRTAVRLSAKEEQSEQPAPDQIAVTDEEAALVREALANLPENYRLPLVLYYRQDHSVHEVAEALELSEDAVKQRLARGREMLRERMTGLIESALTLTRPGAVFTVGIAAAIGALATPTAIASGSFAAAAAAPSSATATTTATTSTAAATITTATLFTIMSTSKLAIVAAAVLATGGFFLGRLTAGKEPEPAAKPAAAIIENRPAARGTGPGSVALASKPDAQAGNVAEAWQQMPAGPERTAAVTEKAKGILDEKNPARRLRLFAEFIEHFQTEDFEAVAASFAYHDQQGRLFGPEYTLFLATAGMVGGEAAMNKIFREGAPMDRPPMESQHSAMTAWAVENPKDAVAWWNNLPESVGKDELARSLISGVAAKDLDYAWRCLDAFPESERAKFMGSLVRQRIGDEGAESAVQWLAGLHSTDGSDVGALKQKGFDSLLNAAVNISPARKSEYINQFAGEPWMQQSNFAARVADQWAKRNGNEAVEWAGGLPDTMRNNALVTAIYAWNKRNPSEFEGWKSAHEADAKFQDAIRSAAELAQAQSKPGG